MTIASQRSIKSAQTKMRELSVNVNVLAGDPTVSGFDAMQIKQVIDVGPGIFTLVFLRPFEQANSNLPTVVATPLEADTAVHVTASAYDRVTINTTDLSNVAADRDVTLLIKGCDHRFNY